MKGIVIYTTLVRAFAGGRCTHSRTDVGSGPRGTTQLLRAVNLTRRADRQGLLQMPPDNTLAHLLNLPCDRD